MFCGYREAWMAIPMNWLRIWKTRREWVGGGISPRAQLRYLYSLSSRSFCAHHVMSCKSSSRLLLFMWSRNYERTIISKSHSLALALEKAGEQNTGLVGIGRIHTLFENTHNRLASLDSLLAHVGASQRAVLCSRWRLSLGI
jgi:hypothetical protein